MENKNLIIGGGVVLAILYFMSKNKKPTAQSGESAEEELSSPVGGGGGFGFPPPLPPTPTTTTTTTTTNTTPSAPKPIIRDKGSGGSIISCPSGYIYDPTKRVCVPYAQSNLSKDKQAQEGSGRTAYQTARTAGSGLTSSTTSGTTTTRPPAGSTAPPSSGTTTSRPVGGGGTTPTCPKGYMYNSVTRKCVKMEDGEVGSGGMLFTGREPLTLDNILC